MRRSICVIGYSVCVHNVSCIIWKIVPVVRLDLYQLFILDNVKTDTYNFKSFGKGLLGLKQEHILPEIIQVEYSVGLIFPLHELHSVL